MTNKKEKRKKPRSDLPLVSPTDLLALEPKHFSDQIEREMAGVATRCRDHEVPKARSHPALIKAWEWINGAAPFCQSTSVLCLRYYEDGYEAQVCYKAPLRVGQIA